MGFDLDSAPDYDFDPRRLRLLRRLGLLAGELDVEGLAMLVEVAAELSLKGPPASTTGSGRDEGGPGRDIRPPAPAPAEVGG